MFRGRLSLVNALATELSNRLKRIDCSSLNFSKSPSNGWLWFKLPERRKASGIKRGDQPTLS